MSQQSKKFYVTTPIYYVNARPHIGHAYTTIVADVLARRHRLLGEDTFFLTGTDEHGQKIERSAAAAGVPPQQFADQVSEQFESLWKRMGITNDSYIRTTSPKHKAGVQKLFTELYDRGHIYLDSYTGAYCVSDEAFVDVQPGEPCPDCGRITEIVTEENFFFRLSAFQRPLLDLIESGTLKIENEARRNEVLSFLRGNFGDALHRNWASIDESLEDKLVASVIERAVDDGVLRKSAAGTTYLPGALKDLSVSRSSFTWGIPVPEDVQRRAGATKTHVVYVWLDALANYITAIGYGSEAPQDLANFAKWWPADMHLVGKEIIRFHCVYWPAFLLAAELPLPRAITAHGWLLFDNSKMSKSKGNIVRTETILDAFGQLCPHPPLLSSSREAGGFASPFPGSDASPTNSALLSSRSAAEGSAFPVPATDPTPHDRDLFASDVLRYFLLREIPFGQDGNFSFDALITRYNADLANGYGNLVSRTLTLIEKSQNGMSPQPSDHGESVIQVALRKIPRGGFSGHPTDIGPFIRTANVELARIAAAIGIFQARSFDEMRFSMAMAFDPVLSALKGNREVPELQYGVLDYTALLIGKTDEFISAHKPWHLAKQDDDASRDELADVLYTAAESIRIITALLYPILPYATARVWAQLGLGDIEEAARNGELKDLQWGGLEPGTKLGPLGPIFPRADKGLAQTMIDMENERSSSAPNKPDSGSRPSLKEALTPATPQPIAADPTHPAAPPRTSSIDEPSGTLPVAGSEAHTTHDGPTPSHTEAQPSGIFSGEAAKMPVTAGPADASPQITIDDFAKVELRVAQIIICERIPKADKLLRLEVDLGYEKRQILSGIAEWYTPEDLIGRRIVVITNLAPRKMRGLESHGMLLAASEEGGKPVLATFGEEIALGSRLK